MLKLIVLFSAFDYMLCETQPRSETTISQVPPCRNPPLCHLSDTYKAASRKISTFLPYEKSLRYDRQGLHLQRSYNGFGSSALPAYYHAFDPISVLASLAFLAFLLQSFASLFERSRSILPTIVSSRNTAMDLTIPDISSHMDSLRGYDNIEDLGNR